MAYKLALEKAWNDISGLTRIDKFDVSFLQDKYEVTLSKREIILLSENNPAKDHIAVLILHYLLKKLELEKIPAAGEDWINFKELDGGDFYWPVFKNRTINPILKKFASNPDMLFDSVRRFSAKRYHIGDSSIIIEPFSNVPILIAIWKGDEELESQADILFDRSITQIFCTEDIAVLSETIAHSL